MRKRTRQLMRKRALKDLLAVDRHDIWGHSEARWQRRWWRVGWVHECNSLASIGERTGQCSGGGGAPDAAFAGD